jgi:phage terminase small subunit
MALTDKQRKFAEEYRLGNDATRAAKLAGYNEPQTAGRRLRKLPTVLAYIKELEEDAPKRYLDLMAQGLKELIDEQKLDNSIQLDRNKVIRALEVLGRNAGVLKKHKPVKEQKELKRYEIVFVDEDRETGSKQG